MSWSAKIYTAPLRLAVVLFLVPVSLLSAANAPRSAFRHQHARAPRRAEGGAARLAGLHSASALHQRFRDHPDGAAAAVSAAAIVARSPSRALVGALRPDESAVGEYPAHARRRGQLRAIHG